MAQTLRSNGSVECFCLMRMCLSRSERYHWIQVDKQRLADQYALLSFFDCLKLLESNEELALDVEDLPS